MAPGTICSIPTFVLIVGLMATETRNRRRSNLGRLFMAGATGDGCVRSTQGEIGQPIVVEPDLAPAARAMAIGTLRPVSTIMRIVFDVAAIAGPCWIAVRIALAMASRAAGLRVAADQ